ncbi:hypothetical protein PRIPAC_77443 [Pristionchus pacificus]|uniref:Uncharacterized protein n=1 Tax=Pristionchus pacificus TaxID=54126 RepID=A0A2A6CBE2_PRIPA|nr:hypothetical protein PRIPAC_77443 [Pristionchus pacificus]|eukprot:PDM75542.1 hypothetical protein PRIPAC_42719 [Pristionchus pacificus]
MGAETPVRNVTSRIPPPSTSILPITKTPSMDRPISHGSQLKNAPVRSRRSSFASSNDVTRPLSTPRQSRRLSTADLPDLNTTSLSTKSSTSGAEIGETPHLPRYMMGTVSSNGPSPFSSSSSSSTRIPLPVRVSSNRNSGKVVPTPSSIGSIASLNELSFSSDRCGPSKRGAEKIEGRTLRGGGVLKNIIHPPKRRRFDEIEEAVFKEKISDDEKMKRFEKKFEVMWLEYEKDIAPILEKKNEIEKENDQTINMKKETMTEEEETSSEKVLFIMDHPILFNQL